MICTEAALPERRTVGSKIEASGLPLPPLAQPRPALEAEVQELCRAAELWGEIKEKCISLLPTLFSSSFLSPNGETKKKKKRRYLFHYFLIFILQLIISISTPWLNALISEENSSRFLKLLMSCG